MIAYKFAKWDAPQLSSLKNSKAYILREKLNNGESLNREEKDWLTKAINNNSYFRHGVPVLGWCFDFTDTCHLYWVKQGEYISEYYAMDKTSLRNMLSGKVDSIVELI